MRVLRFVPVAVAVLSFSSPAFAERRKQGTHIELTWGFLGGERSYAHQSFAYSEGGVSPALEAPFVGEPFDGVPVAGMGFEVRWVQKGVRAGIGAEYPFPKIEPNIMLATAGGGPPAKVRSLDTEEFRLLFGYEYPVSKQVALYADLIGTAYTADAKVTFDGEQSTYTTSGFGFSARGGARLHINKYYFAYAHGEGGMTEHVIWAAHAGLGFFIGDN
jgi:hypothetical protein